MSKMHVYNKVIPFRLCDDIIKKFNNCDVENHCIYNIQMCEYKIPIQDKLWERIENTLSNVLLSCLLKYPNTDNLILDSFCIQKYVTDNNLFIDRYNTNLSRYNKLTFILYLSDFKSAEVKLINEPEDTEIKEINKSTLIIIPEDIKYNYQHELHKGNNYVITGQLRTDNNKHTIGRMVKNDYFNPSF